MKILVVIDMQYDFIDGSLGTNEAEQILPLVVEKIKTFDGKVFATRDTHGEDYLYTIEGKKLPIPHCIKDTKGWELHDAIASLITEPVIDKPTFGSYVLGEVLQNIHSKNPIKEITFVGVCTDICVISNALIVKAYLPEVIITVDSTCCAGVTPATHLQALEAMKMCHLQII